MHLFPFVVMAAVDHIVTNLCCRTVLGLVIVLDEPALCLQYVALDSAVLDIFGFEGRYRFGQTCPGIGTKYKIFVRISVTPYMYNV